jgi:hypothetical protein
MRQLAHAELISANHLLCPPAAMVGVFLLTILCKGADLSVLVANIC